MHNIDVLLIHPPYHRRAGSGVIPPIGLAYLASSVEENGYSVNIIDCALDCSSQSPDGLVKFQQYLERELPKYQPKFIGIGPSTTPALKSLRVLSVELKKHFPSTPLIYGGPFASMPDQASIFFDLLGATALVRGEGEDVFPQLLKVLSDKAYGTPITGVVWNSNNTSDIALIQNMDKLRFPARHLLDNQRYKPSLRRNVFDTPITAIYLSRGCPYNCNFCVSPILRGNKIVRRSNQNLYSEMIESREKYGIRGFIFYDDCLFLKSKDLNCKVQEFCADLNSNLQDITWEMEMRCDAVATLTNESFLDLYNSGCRQINMGIEKASNTHLNYLNKGLTTSEIINACNSAKEASPLMRLSGTFILGGANETESDILAEIEFAKSLPIDFAHFYPLEIYPGTPLFYETNQKQTSTQWAYQMLEDETNYWGEILYESPQLSSNKLIELAQLAYQEFYFRQEWENNFLLSTEPALHDVGLAIIKRWCKDRFQLSPDEANTTISNLL